VAKNIKTFRHELKYYINFFEYHKLRLRLEKVLSRDSYSNTDGNYHIRSLYFDDMSNSALFEKQAGILSRKKFRIRIYNLNDNNIKLEKKERVGHFIRKESAKLSIEDYLKILDGDLGFLMDSNNPVFRQFYIEIRQRNLRPNVIVDYVREAYISNISNIRITFDKELKTGLTNVDLFNKKIPTIKALDEPWMILEVKYNNFLPDYIRNILQLQSQQRYAISKFVICKKMVKTNHWEDN
jgi:hypothetical protein